MAAAVPIKRPPGRTGTGEVHPLFMFRRCFEQRSPGQTDPAALGIHFEHLHLHGIAHLHHILDFVNPFASQLGDMDHAVFSGQEFDDHADFFAGVPVADDLRYRAFVFFTELNIAGEVCNPVDSLQSHLRIMRRHHDQDDIHDINLSDVLAPAIIDNVVNRFTALADDLADLLRINAH